MSKVLTPESVALRPDARYFSPARLANLKRIFDVVCKEENITSEEQRDELAGNLLEASKFTKDEKTLVAVLKFDIGGYRKYANDFSKSIIPMDLSSNCPTRSNCRPWGKFQSKKIKAPSLRRTGPGQKTNFQTKEANHGLEIQVSRR